ncbi:hypothetical protein TWF718_005907 [Orbilia javanica]|uniref:Uncharacterized protein n=1 Tax=Orbilia javanica TaxID=47235 RepID=A0AAN8MVL2_9PEZI
MVATKLLLGAFLSSTALGFYIPHIPRAEYAKSKTSSDGYHTVSITSSGRVVSTMVYNKNMTMHGTGTGTGGTYMPTITPFPTMSSKHNKTMYMTASEDTEDDYDMRETSTGWDLDDMDDMTDYPTTTMKGKMTTTDMHMTMPSDDGEYDPSPTDYEDAEETHTHTDDKYMPTNTDEDMPSPTDNKYMPSSTDDKDMPSPTGHEKEAPPSYTMKSSTMVMTTSTGMGYMPTETMTPTMTDAPAYSPSAVAPMPTSPAGKSDGIFTDKTRYQYYSKVTKDQLVYISNHEFPEIDKYGKVKLVAFNELRNSMVAGKEWFEKQQEKNGKPSVCAVPAYAGGESQDPLIYCNKESRYGVRLNNLMNTAWTENCWDIINQAVWLTQAVTSGNTGIPEGELPEYYMTANNPIPSRFFQHGEIEVTKARPWNVTGQVFKGGNPLRLAYITLENPGCPDTWKNI